MSKETRSGAAKKKKVFFPILYHSYQRSLGSESVLKVSEKHCPNMTHFQQQALFLRRRAHSPTQKIGVSLISLNHQNQQKAVGRGR